MSDKVVIIVSEGGAGGTERYRGEVDISSNEFPETGGTNDMRSGRPKRGDRFLAVGDPGTLKDRAEADLEVVPGDVGVEMMYTGADDGDMQLGANWKVNQG